MADRKDDGAPKKRKAAPKPVSGAPPKARAKAKASAKTQSRSGQEVLAQVRALIGERSRTPEGAPRRAEIDREAKSLPAADAIAALEAWLSQHAGSIVVHRGTATDAAERLAAEHGKLHPLHRGLLEAFDGALEVTIDPARWPHLRHGDGFRLIGISPDRAECDLAAQLPRYHAIVDGALSLYEHDLAKQKSLTAARAMLPMWTTLEGVADAWVASGSKLDWVTDARIGRPPRREAAAHPRIGAPFALVARLVALEARLDGIARWIEVAEIVGRVAPVHFDARGQLRLIGDPHVAMSFGERPGAVATLVVRAELAHIPRSHGNVEPLFERRMQQTDAALHATTLCGSTIDVLWARADLLRDGLTTEDVQHAIASVRHARERFAGGAALEHDGEIHALPAAAEALLCSARADAAGLTGRLAASNRRTDDVQITCVGRAHPRVRWSYVPPRAPFFAGHSHLGHPLLWHAAQVDGVARLEAELALATLTEARIEALMSSL